MADLSGAWWGSGRADHYHYRVRVVSAASDSRKTHQWGMSKCTRKVQYIYRRISTCNATDVMSERVPIIVIVGGGFRGLSAAKALRRAPVRLLLIDRTNHHLFRPLLYQAATSVLSPPQIASPIRGIHGIRVIHGHGGRQSIVVVLCFHRPGNGRSFAFIQINARWHGSRSSDQSPLADARVRLVAERPRKES
jgi:hypothetical protein